MVKKWNKKLMYKEIIEIINKRDMFKELFLQLKKHYEKTGKLTGTIHFKNVSLEARTYLFYIGSKTSSQEKISVKIEKFFLYFMGEKYKNLSLEKLMDELYKGKLVYSGDLKSQKENEMVEYFKILPLNEWSSNNKNILIRKTYKESPKKLLEYVLNIEKAVKYIRNDEGFQNNYIPLPILSAKITKDSHYFDSDKISGKLFLSYLSFLSKDRSYKTGEEISELLYEHSIVRDEFFNFTLAYNILSEKNWNSFWDDNQPLNISLYNLRNIEKLDSIHKKVFIFENPSVFRDIMEKLQEHKIKVSLLCTTGQLNVSSLIILDKLVANNTTLYYSSDFDPEGLQIAQKLRYRYGDKLQFLNMDVEDYNISRGEKSIETRLEKLKSINLEEFTKLVLELQKFKKAGYQEVLLDRYFESIINILNGNSE